MKIVYVITQATWGGAQAHLYSLIKYQAAIGNNITLVCGGTGRLSEQIKKEFHSVEVISISSLVRRISPINDLKAVHALRGLLRNIRPDIVHLHSSKAGMVGRLAAAGLSMKVIFTVHGWGFTPGVGTKRQILMKYIEKILQPLTTYYICVSKFDYDLGVKNRVITAKHPGFVIHNGVSELSFPVKKRESFVLSMAARFDMQKRQDVVIRALSYIPDDVPIVCNFLGDGPLIQECKSLAQSLHVGSKVKFYGVVDNVQKYYSQSDAAILISDYEGLPISLVEALAQSLPIVASNVGGINELIDRNGFLVKNDPQEISEKLLLLYKSNQIDEIKNNSYEMYQRHYTESEMLEETQDCYLRCLA